MWIENLTEVQNSLKDDYDEEINVGATVNEINRFKEKIGRLVQGEIPQEFFDLINKVNGLEYNGFILYGIDENLLDSTPNQDIYGLLEYNKIWYENEHQKEYFFWGESNISWYVYKFQSQKYYELDNPSGREIKSYNSIVELFDKMLSDALL